MWHCMFQWQDSLTAQQPLLLLHRFRPRNLHGYTHHNSLQSTLSCPFQFTKVTSLTSSLQEWRAGQPPTFDEAIGHSRQQRKLGTTQIMYPNNYKDSASGICFSKMRSDQNTLGDTAQQSSTRRGLPHHTGTTSLLEP